MNLSAVFWLCDIRNVVSPFQVSEFSSVSQKLYPPSQLFCGKKEAVDIHYLGQLLACMGSARVLSFLPSALTKVLQRDRACKRVDKMTVRYIGR